MFSLLFPYYIVRFKPGAVLAYFLIEKKFPYYIVRFKQKIRHEHISELEGFHTT